MGRATHLVNGVLFVSCLLVILAVSHFGFTGGTSSWSLHTFYFSNQENGCDKVQGKYVYLDLILVHLAFVFFTAVQHIFGQCFGFCHN